MELSAATWGRCTARRTLHWAGRIPQRRVHLATPNYGYEKRKKEIDRKAKKDAKREERLQRKREGATAGADEPAPAPPEGSPPSE